MQPNHHAVATADAVQVVPASQLGRSKRGGERLPGPAREAVDPLVRFAVRCSFGQVLPLPRYGPKGCEPQFHLQDPARGEELLVVPCRRMNPEALGMDLVDGHVNVFVVLVVVAGGDVLVVREPQRVDQVLHNMPELRPVEASVFWVERDNEVVGAGFPCSCILRLDGLDESAVELDVVGRGHTREIGSQEPGRSGGMAPAPDVAREPTKAIFRSR